jgi:hypothetical protein
MNDRLGVIRAFAKMMTPSKEYKNLAIIAHRDLIEDKKYKLTKEYRFMSEVDNECPDYFLRSKYRRELNSV